MSSDTFDQAPYAGNIFTNLIIIDDKYSHLWCI